MIELATFCSPATPLYLQSHTPPMLTASMQYSPLNGVNALTTQSLTAGQPGQSGPLCMWPHPQSHRVEPLQEGEELQY